jgi:uncharacterized protein (DUF2141 family)
MTLRPLLLATLSLLASAPTLAADTVTLHVVVTGLKTSTGHIRACVFKTADNFPHCDKGVGVVTASASANGETVKFDIPGVTPGEGAISLFVDVNDNKQLDRGLMGIPKEPLGFSNNPAVTFGPPSFKDSAITIGADTTTTIKLKYF